MNKRILVLVFTLFLVATLTPNAMAQSKKFTLEEATIADIHAAMKSGKLTCRNLVEMYLAVEIRGVENLHSSNSSARLHLPFSLRSLKVTWQ